MGGAAVYQLHGNCEIVGMDIKDIPEKDRKIDRKISCALGIYQQGTTVDYMQLLGKINYSTPKTATWSCIDSFVESGRSFRPDSPTSDSNNCMANPDKSFVKVNGDTVDINYHFHRPFAVQKPVDANDKMDNALSVGQSYKVWVIIGGLDNNQYRTFYAPATFELLEPASAKFLAFSALVSVVSVFSMFA